MNEISLSVPERLAEALPEDDDAILAMEREVDQYEGFVNDAIAEGEGAQAATDLIERLEERWEQYDTYIVELRSWGQSSIYAEVWCDFQYALIRQLHEHDDLAEQLDRERNARLVDDGIRLRDARE